MASLKNKRRLHRRALLLKRALETFYKDPAHQQQNEKLFSIITALASFVVAIYIIFLKGLQQTRLLNFLTL